MALFNESKFINNQMHPVFYVRKMIEDDVNEVLEIWGENDLHEGTETIKSFLKVDPDGFWVAVDDAHGMSVEVCFEYDFLFIFIFKFENHFIIFVCFISFENIAVFIGIWHFPFEKKLLLSNCEI